MNTNELIEAEDKYFINTFTRQPIVLDHGKGVKVWDKDGNEYIDMFAGIAVNALGHAHPKLVNALQGQVEKLIHVSNIYYNEPAIEYAKKLLPLTEFDRLFYANSGAEANEGAIKLALKYTGKSEIITAKDSFHGRTLLTLAATGHEEYREPYLKNLPQGFIEVPYNDIEAIKEAISDETAAIMLEPIQGEGGVNTAPQGFSYLEEVRALCNQHNWLMMLDEIQTGNGRTGKYFAYQHTNIIPDVMTTAKGLGNGFPVGAVMTQGKAVGLLGAGSHGSTYGGTVLGSRVVYTVLDTLENENAVENAAVVGAYIVDQLRAQLIDQNVQVRGFGMMIGVQLPKDCAELVAIARDQYKLIINVTAGSVVRLLPPLNLTQAQADELLKRLVPAIQGFLAA